MHKAHWEHFHHQADIGVRGIGPSLSVAFEQAGLAMTAVITQPELVQQRTELAVQLEGVDKEFLFYQWLNELVYLMATRHLLFGRFRVEIDGKQLTASAWGEPVEPLRHQPAVEIKGATLTALQVRQRDDGLWLAQCVVDV
jgi:tRNA nucleotidyltransferase (CCA-adding enzyme)